MELKGIQNEYSNRNILYTASVSSMDLTTEECVAWEI